MNPATIAALATAIVSIISAITAAIVAIKGNVTANNAHARINDIVDNLTNAPVRKDPS